MPFNSKELSKRLGGIAPKVALGLVLIVGFLFLLVYWRALTPEQHQDITENNLIYQNFAKYKVTESHRVIELSAAEKQRIRQTMLQQAKVAKLDPIILSLSKQVRLHVADDFTAQGIARWVLLYGERYDLPPELILGLIAVESQFDPFAVSGVGARGLMQVMPFWKKELGTKQDNLFEIGTNIRYGCAILRTYINRYRSVGSALAAYNGSLGSMRYPNKIFAKMPQFDAYLEFKKKPSTQ
ncbi:MAG: lytic transglycosylase domain-containing protein [Mariprofundaceae bacterium]|nr:lytic transglycosylase domain-containing protein [Mariprofundaceae bacterium]